MQQNGRLGLHCSGPATWGIFGKPWNSAKWWILKDFRSKFKCPEKLPKLWIWPISGDFGNMPKSTHRNFKKRLRKIPKSNKKASSEAILPIIWAKMGAAFGRFQKKAAAFGRRPLLVPFWTPVLCPECSLCLVLSLTSLGSLWRGCTTVTSS